MSADYEQEQRTLENSNAELKCMVDTCEEQSLNIKSFLKCVRKYTEPCELTPDMLHELVEKIIVYAPDKSSGHRTQQIDIYYSYVGIVDIPTDEEMREMEREYMRRTTRQTA